MKRWIAGLLTLALVLTLFTPTMLPAYAESSAKKGKVNYSAVHLRSEPWGEILDLVYQGDQVLVYGSTEDSEGNSWYQLDYQGQPAYIYANYVDLETGTNGGESTSSRPAEVSHNPSGGHITVASPFARVRVSPWGRALGIVTKGHMLEVSGSTRDANDALWYQVIYQGTEGYMHSANLDYSSQIARENLSGYLKVNWKFARLRSFPWGQELGRLVRDQIVEVTGRTRDSDGAIWFEVDYEGGKAYVHEGNVLYSQQEFLPEPVKKGSLRVNYSVLNVRKEPTTSSEIVGEVYDLSVHDYVDVATDSRGDSWYRIAEGWVHGSYVDLDEQKVKDLSVVLSSNSYTGNPLEISARAFGTNRALYRISLKEGSSYRVLSELSNNSKALFTPTRAGKYTIKVEARDVQASKIEKVFEETFELKANSNNHQVTYVEHGSLEDFAKSQVGRALIWRDGFWVDATYDEILREMDPANALTFKVPTAKPLNFDKVEIIDVVNARSGPGTEFISYGYAYAGEVYSVYDTKEVDGYDWHQINFSGNQAWVRSDFTRNLGEGTALPSQKLGNFVKIIDNGTPLRKSASVNSEALVHLGAKQTYMVLDKSGSWIKVQHNDHQGWIRSQEAVATDEVNRDMFMFLDLRSSTGITAQELNKVLEGKGILEGQGAAFVEASKRHDVNEIYLVSHALLETGNGHSALATGQVVDGVMVYNMYGIGAYDQDPVGMGAKTAYDEGWITPELAIVDGAKWIGERYIHNSQGQYTLYKMRYNHLNIGHQYATDVAWARSQTSRIEELYGQVSGYRLRFEIPIYTDR